MARKNITMTDTEVHEFLTESARTVQVATLGKDGSPHLAPMWFVVMEGKVVFRSFTKSQKIVNLVRDPRISILIEAGAAYAELQGVIIKGTATLVTDPDYVLKVYEGLAARYPMIGETPVDLDDDALNAAFGRFAPKNTAVIVEPATVTSWDHTKLAGAY